MYKSRELRFFSDLLRSNAIVFSEVLQFSLWNSFGLCITGFAHFVRSVMAVTALANAKDAMPRKVRGKDWVV